MERFKKKNQLALILGFSLTENSIDFKGNPCFIDNIFFDDFRRNDSY